MLKLYYGIDKYLEVGHLNRDNWLVQLDGNDTISFKDDKYDKGEHTILCALPTEVKSVKEFLDTASEDVIYPIYLDAQNTISTYIGVSRD